MSGSSPDAISTRKLIFLCAAMLVAFAGACEKKPAAPGAGPAKQAMPVQVQLVHQQEIADSSEYLAILKSRHSATINPQVEGQITKIFVKSGDCVKPGQALLQIDPLKQQATVSSQEGSRAAQEANLRNAKTQLDRVRNCWKPASWPSRIWITRRLLMMPR